MVCLRCKNVMQDDDLYCGKCGLSRHNIFYNAKNILFLNYKKILSIVVIIVIFVLGFYVGNRSLKKHEETIENKQIDEAFTQMIMEVKPVTDYAIDTLAVDMDSISFGTYIQKSSNENVVVENDESSKTLNNESAIIDDASDEDDKIYVNDKIEWIVLEIDKENKKALLFSKYILDMHAFDKKSDNITWENSEIRRWLNEDFYNEAFDEKEKERILETELKNDYDYDINYIDANDDVTSDERVRLFKIDKNTVDKIFLLSANEIEKYFGVEESTRKVTRYGKNAIAKETDYGRVAKWGFPDDSPNRHSTYGIDEDEEIEYDWAVGNNAYLIREPIRVVAGWNDCVSIINAYGRRNVFWPSDLSNGIRPAMWVSY